MEVIVESEACDIRNDHFLLAIRIICFRLMFFNLLVPICGVFELCPHEIDILSFFFELAPPPPFFHCFQDQLPVIALTNWEEDLLIMIALHLPELYIMKLTLFLDELVITLKFYFVFLCLLVVKNRLFFILTDVFSLQLADYRFMAVLSCEKPMRRSSFLLTITLRNLEGRVITLLWTLFAFLRTKETRADAKCSSLF